MLVFTDEWIERLRHRYRQHAEYERPRIYFIATLDDWRDRREQIETWVEALPQVVQRDLIPRLRNDRSFIETYNELLVGYSLKQLGYQVEYNHEFNGLTPDWYTYGKDNVPPFVVEVFSVRLTRESQEVQRRIMWLHYYLEQIPISAALDIKVEQRQVLPEPQHSKRIAEKIHSWLLNTQPPVDAQFQISNLMFTRLEAGDNLPSVSCGGTGRAFMVDTTRLRTNIDTKLARYKAVVMEKGIPFVVATVADTLTGLSFDNFKDVLLGQEAVQIAYDNVTGDILKQQLIRQLDGVMTRSSARAALSAGLWVKPLTDNQSQIRALHNAYAANPIVQEAFIAEQDKMPSTNLQDR
jgi:hypothetical protein